MSPSVCRVCLDGNVRMHSIEDSKLVQVFEKLTRSTLKAVNGMPITVCSICVSQLKRCLRFSDMAKESKRTRTQQLLSGIQMSRSVSAIELGTMHGLSVTTLPNLTIMDHSILRSSITEVKEEYVFVKEETADEEDLLTEIKDKHVDAVEGYPVEQPLAEENIDESFSLDKKYVYCGICNMKYTTKRSLKAHLRKHSGENPYTCNSCSKTFHLKPSLKKHMFSHTEERPFSCNICAKAFKTADALKSHKRSHTEKRPHSCNVCSKSFIRPCDLRRHIIYCNTGEKPYICNICSNSFMRPSNLKTHIMCCHTGERPYICNLCGKTYNVARELSVHMISHTGVKPHACTACNKTFTQRATLKVHNRTCKIYNRIFSRSE